MLKTRMQPSSQEVPGSDGAEPLKTPRQNVASHTHMYVHTYYIYIYICSNTYVYLGIHTSVYIYIWSRAPRPPTPQMVWEAVPRPPPVVWTLVGLIGNPPPSFPPASVGSASPSLPHLLTPLWCGVWWGRVCAWLFWWGRIRGPSRVGSPGGREAALVRQTLFFGRRFCSETRGCPFRCSGRPSGSYWGLYNTEE